jgi:hypothetical protein
MSPPIAANDASVSIDQPEILIDRRWLHPSSQTCDKANIRHAGVTHVNGCQLPAYLYRCQ